MQVVDLTEVVDDSDHRYIEPYSIKLIVVHRIELRHPTGEMMTPLEICQEFMRRKDLGTGLDIPYHYLIDMMGNPFQCLPLSEAGAHAANFNATALGVGVLGDFRKHEIGVGQEQTLVELCAELCLSVDGDPLGSIDWDGAVRPEWSVSGHSELHEASKNDCPGKLLPMQPVRNSINEWIVGKARERLGAVA